MKNKLLKKLYGFDCAPKDRFNLLIFGVLKFQEFILYEFYITITDWDRRHPTYGCVNTTNREVAILLGCDTSTITRNKNRLIAEGFLLKEPDGTFKTKDFEQWTWDYWKKVKDSGVKKHMVYADLHNESEYLHKSRFKQVSYKEKVSRDISLSSVINTEDEFEKAAKVIFSEET